jgi:cyclophilin family peptidyl-prolyl cis-trans isomerase
VDRLPRPHVDVTNDSLIVETTGDEDKNDSLVEVLKPFGIIEMVRTGTVAMARTPDPDSAGSQFYICLAPQPSLDRQYATFGQVFEGIDAVQKIVVGDKMTKVTVADVPIAKIRQAMKTARLEEVPAPDIGDATGPPGLSVRRMYKPEAAGHAEMITGGPDEVAARLVAIMSEKGVLR